MKFYHAKIWSACAVELINTGSVMRGEWSPFAVFGNGAVLMRHRTLTVIRTSDSAASDHENFYHHSLNYTALYRREKTHTR